MQLIYSQRPDTTACAEFDVSDTGTRYKSREFKLWEYSDEYEQAVRTMFADKHGSDNELIW
jgi:hypothetical protein